MADHVPLPHGRKQTKNNRGGQRSLGPGFPTDPAAAPATVAAWPPEGLPFLGLGHTAAHQLLSSYILRIEFFGKKGLKLTKNI